MSVGVGSSGEVAVNGNTRIYAQQTVFPVPKGDVVATTVDRTANTYFIPLYK